MDTNVGAADRQIRTGLGAVTGVAALVALAGAAPLPAVLAPILGVVSLVMLATAATGTCGIYALLGMDSCSMETESAQ